MSVPVQKVVFKLRSSPKITICLGKILGKNFGKKLGKELWRERRSMNKKYTYLSSVVYFLVSHEGSWLVMAILVVFNFTALSSISESVLFWPLLLSLSV